MKKLIFGLMFAAAALSAGEFRVEAESFKDLKSWISQNDKRAVDSGVIRSNQKGTANSIKATFSCPEAGTYYVFVRTLDIGEKSRKTTVKINDLAIGSFGDDNTPEGKKSAYFWNKSAKPVELAKGDFTIELIPNSNYSRVDSIVFTTDANYNPPNSPRSAEDIEDIDAK